MLGFWASLVGLLVALLGFKFFRPPALGFLCALDSPASVRRGPFLVQVIRLNM